jgi:hypothetical protein
MRNLPLIPALLAAAFACSCETAPAPVAPSQTTSDEPPEITKDVAVAMARRDAAAHFREVGVSFVNVQQAGRFWVVELRGPGGRGVHYAISRSNGSIRERTVIQ